MAQTKTSGSRKKSASSRSRGGSNTKRSNGGSPKASTRRATTSSSKRSGGKSNSSRASSARSSASRKAATSRSSASRSSARRESKSTIGTIAEKAKGPAMAGGAALVGLAGGLALNHRNRKRGVLDRIPSPKMRKPNISMPKPKIGMPKLKTDDALKRLAETAGTVAQRSRQIGDMATEVQKASDAINKKR